MVNEPYKFNMEKISDNPGDNIGTSGAVTTTYADTVSTTTSSGSRKSLNLARRVFNTFSRRSSPEPDVSVEVTNSSARYSGELRTGNIQNKALIAAIKALNKLNKKRKKESKDLEELKRLSEESKNIRDKWRKAQEAKSSEETKLKAEKDRQAKKLKKQVDKYDKELREIKRKLQKLKKSNESFLEGDVTAFLLLMQELTNMLYEYDPVVSSHIDRVHKIQETIITWYEVAEKKQISLPEHIKVLKLHYTQDASSVRARVTEGKRGEEEKARLQCFTQENGGAFFTALESGKTRSVYRDSNARQPLMVINDLNIACISPTKSNYNRVDLNFKRTLETLCSEDNVKMTKVKKAFSIFTKIGEVHTERNAFEHRILQSLLVCNIDNYEFQDLTNVFMPYGSALLEQDRNVIARYREMMTKLRQFQKKVKEAIEQDTYDSIEFICLLYNTQKEFLEFYRKFLNIEAENKKTVGITKEEKNVILYDDQDPFKLDIKADIICEGGLIDRMQAATKQKAIDYINNKLAEFIVAEAQHVATVMQGYGTRKSRDCLRKLAEQIATGETTEQAVKNKLRVLNRNNNQEESRQYVNKLLAHTYTIEIIPAKKNSGFRRTIQISRNGQVLGEVNTNFRNENIHVILNKALDSKGVFFKEEEHYVLKTRLTAQQIGAEIVAAKQQYKKSKKRADTGLEKTTQPFSIKLGYAGNTKPLPADVSLHDVAKKIGRYCINPVIINPFNSTIMVNESKRRTQRVANKLNNNEFDFKQTRKPLRFKNTGNYEHHHGITLDTGDGLNAEKAARERFLKKWEQTVQKRRRHCHHATRKAPDILSIY